MSLLDSITKGLKSEISRAANQAVNKTVNNVVKGVEQKIENGVNGITGKGSNKEEKFTFNSLPTSVAELMLLPESNLDTAFKTVALTMAVLCNYENNKEVTYDMLNVLKGPEPLSNMEKSQLNDRLVDKYYKPFSFFDGATKENGYKPSTPYKISVYENPYSFDNENWATMWVKSSGADSERCLILRKKPSTGQWFLNDIQCLADIRIPTAEDKWA